MTSRPYRTITVSRQFGTGGWGFCQELAKKLCLPIFGKEILSMMAVEMKTSEEIVDTYEKMRYGGPEFILTTFSKRYSFLEKEIIESRKYIRSLRKVMRQIISLGGSIILGRGGQCILHDQPACLHLRLVAELTDRVNRLSGLDKYSQYNQKRLEKLIREKDAARATFTREHFHRNIDDPTLYHLVVNLSQISLDQAVSTVSGLVHSECPLP